MQNASEIYAQSVRQLPATDRLKLAALILEDLTEEQTAVFENANISALDLLESLPEKRLFQTPDEVELYIREERESWER
jgi:hypothetical protein